MGLAAKIALNPATGEGPVHCHQVDDASRAQCAHTATTEKKMDIERFMRGYKAAWEARDETAFCALFAEDGVYHNTPFAVQRGHAQLAAYWQRVKLQENVELTFEVLSSTPDSGIAHWHVTYQVASEELFQIWASSTGTNLIARKPGAPLPRMVLDGLLQASFGGGLCSDCRLWWHSMPLPG